MATEHLLKAFLASLHPVLVVDGRDFESLLYATGHGPRLQVQGTQTRTIQLGEAYDRVQKILKTKLPPRPRPPKPWPLADARNGVAHAGFHDSTKVTEVFTKCLEVIDVLLAELGVGFEYWGDHLALHDELVAVQVEEGRLRVQGKLAKARRTFSTRYGGLHDRDRLLVLAAAARINPVGGYGHDAPAVCPACAMQGCLRGETWADILADTVVLYPSYFDCGACDLRLEMEELDMVGLPIGDGVDLEIAPADFYEDWEPDEDFELDDEDPLVDADVDR
ncbi:hypothetical protein R2B67_18030 [Streptomyces cyaneofuscatus]|uniref:hypothetical protein n=1 Tax=Streptomyces cyaneofuscatus TaxID=66883 RepID=UPI002954A9A2|nr:hypothetical protein [Streptomyces cyaneofuscatus]WOP10322.1 hypothetical protein R2B67_18030 [Streptomyces cyaneofuscatus]